MMRKVDEEEEEVEAETTSLLRYLPPLIHLSLGGYYRILLRLLLSTLVLLMLSLSFSLCVWLQLFFPSFGRISPFR